MMMRADHLAHGEIAEPQPSPGFLLAPFGWAAGPVAAMMRADRSLFADLFAIRPVANASDRAGSGGISICQCRQKSVHCWIASLVMAALSMVAAAPSTSGRTRNALLPA